MNATATPYDPERHAAIETGNGEVCTAFEIGSKVRFVTDVADDVKTGAVAVVTDLDAHEQFPVTVTVQKPGGADIPNLPVRLNEIEADK